MSPPTPGAEPRPRLFGLILSSNISALTLFYFFHVLVIFIFILFIPMYVFQPHCSSHPPAFSSPNFLFPPIPHSSVCQSLNTISLSRLINITVSVKSCLCFSPPNSTSFLLFLVTLRLILALLFFRFSFVPILMSVLLLQSPPPVTNLHSFMN